MQDVTPPKLTWLNNDERFAVRRQIELEYAAHGLAETEPMAFRAMPTPILRITDPGFQFDYFDLGVVFASQKLRAALDLGAEAALYRDIDVSQSAPSVQAKHYNAMQVLTFVNPIDQTKTPGATYAKTLPDGSVRQEWIVAPPDPNDPRRIYWQEDFTAPAPLFRIPGTAWAIATDALADKVMRAGITDIVFQDLTSDRAQTEIVLREIPGSSLGH